MAYEVIMGLSASYAIVFVGTFTEYPCIHVQIKAAAPIGGAAAYCYIKSM